MLSFRPVTLADVPELFVVRVQTRENRYSLEELAGIGITEGSICAALQASFSGWLCEDGERVVGFALGDSSNGEMTVIAVLPEYEGRGVGRGLLSRVEQWLGSQGCERIWLTTDMDPSLRAYGFYRQLGWQDWKQDDNLRYMEKQLSHSQATV